MKRKLEAAEVVLARETQKRAELEVLLDDPEFYAGNGTVVAETQSRHAKATQRVKDAEAIWLAAAEAYEAARVTA